MSEKNSMPETLETLGQKIIALGKSIDARFAQVDAGFAQVDAGFAQVDTRFAQVDTRFAQVDARFAQIEACFVQVDARFAQVDARFAQAETRLTQVTDELKAHLNVKIETLDAKITLVYDTVVAQNARNVANEKTHTWIEKRLDDHDTRILALEKPNPPTSGPADPALP
jgi:uncharacterized protein (DUF3084 family)